MNSHSPRLFLSLAATMLARTLCSQEADLPELKITGDWQIAAAVRQPAVDAGSSARQFTAQLDVPPPTIVTVTAEKYPALPLFNSNTWGGWAKGAPLRGVLAQETTTPYLLDPASLQLRSGPEADAHLFELGKDYAADLVWGSIGRLPGGRIQDQQPVYAAYLHAQLRIDAVVLTRDGRLAVRPGHPRSAAPFPAPLAEGDRRLANIWLSGRLAKLGPDNLFPILETAFPEPPKPTPSSAERLLPKTMKKLSEGLPLRILAWGDSVTDGSYLVEQDRWQGQFVARLRQRFPQAKIELLTEAWGGRNTASYLAEPPGSSHNYAEKVLGPKPDLIVSEFVNDAGLTPEQVEQRYGRFLAEFNQIGAEWIILTPHYVRPDWMGLKSERDVDNDPRPYVAGLRQFAVRHGVALADASARYGRLWRQGIPYNSLMTNSINHPDARGMKIFTDSLMALFP